MAIVGKEARIEWILSKLRLGLDRKDFLQEFTTIYNVCDKTFDSLLKTAKERHEVENKAKEQLRGTILSEALKSEIQAEILTEQELDLIMSRIVDGNIEIREYIKGEPIIRDTSPMEIIAAATQLYKRKGSYAPLKVADTTVEGKDKEAFIELENGTKIPI